jgi:hypothetical protein
MRDKTYNLLVTQYAGADTATYNIFSAALI